MDDNRIPSKALEGITDPFLNFNGVTVEVWEWTRYFVLHFVIYIDTYACGD